MVMKYTITKVAGTYLLTNEYGLLMFQSPTLDRVLEVIREYEAQQGV